MTFFLLFWISDEEPSYSERLQLLQKDDKSQPHQQHACEPLGLLVCTPILHVVLWLLHQAGPGEKTAFICNSVSSRHCLGISDPVFINCVFSSYFHQLDIENEVNNEMANRMSLFYAEATPMLKTLSNATMHFVSEVSEAEHWGAFFLNCTGKLLAGLIYFCVSHLEQNPANREHDRLPQHDDKCL